MQNIVLEAGRRQLLGFFPRVQPGGMRSLTFSSPTCTDGEALEPLPPFSEAA